MNLSGIKFVSLKKPFRGCLETFWTAFWFIHLIFGAFLYIPPLIFLLFTSYWWVTLAVVSWIYLDRNKCETGGRPAKWVQNWTCWRYIRDYLNTQLILDEDFKLNSKWNYLFCAFPHGIIPMGMWTGVVIKASKFHEMYPDFDVKLAVISANFLVPYIRELMLSMLFISCSSKSLNCVLSRPTGGNIVVLLVGGVKEVLCHTPGKYTFVVKNRKGFVRLALQNGVPLVPVITFGDNNLFDHYQSSTLKKFQNFVKKYLGFAPIIFSGRGFFQDSFGIIPRRTRLTTVLGKPIEVEKLDQPTNEQVDDLHANFIKELELLFEKYKHKCLENPEETHLTLV